MNNETQKANATSDITINTSSVSTKTQCEDTIPKKIVGIYGLRNKTTGKWYVGQSVNVHERWKNYKRIDCKKQKALYRALVKHGYEDFDTLLLEECDAISWILDYREMYWIRLLNARGNGYNLTEGGGVICRGKKSKEHQEKITKALTGKKRRPFSEIAKLNMSVCKQGENNYWHGKVLSEEHKKNVSAAKLGKPLKISEEERIRRAERARHMNKVKKIKKLSNIDSSTICDTLVKNECV
jgi:group I intron endonuclease